MYSTSVFHLDRRGGGMVVGIERRCGSNTCEQRSQMLGPVFGSLRIGTRRGRLALLFSFNRMFGSSWDGGQLVSLRQVLAL